jgi:hypothetical protein
VGVQILLYLFQLLFQLCSLSFLRVQLLFECHDIAFSRLYLVSDQIRVLDVLEQNLDRKSNSSYT